jgi:hypothetical protein
MLRQDMIHARGRVMAFLVADREDRRGMVCLYDGVFGKVLCAMYTCDVSECCVKDVGLRKRVKDAVEISGSMRGDKRKTVW